MLDINLLKESAADFEAALKTQQEFERMGDFNRDEIENTYDGCDPVDETFNYLKRRYRDRFKHHFYMQAIKKYCKKINKELTHLKVVGRYNLFGIRGGYIVTCNHISKVDSFAVRAAVKMDLKFVAADFNNWKGKMGNISRNTGYLPIPANLNLAVMRKFNHAMEYFLRKKWPILIYPEQAMWKEYKKPRPLKKGAFHYAAKYHRPIVPLFITIADKPERYDAEGRANFGDYTVHILPPIYPKKDLDEKANTEYMMQANFEAWRRCYEQTYGVPLMYDTEVTADTDPLVKQYARSTREAELAKQPPTLTNKTTGKTATKKPVKTLGKTAAKTTPKGNRKKSVNLYFNPNFDVATKLRTIKRLGYDAYYTGISDAHEKLSWREQVALGRKLGLELTMIHCQYDQSKLNSFWLPGPEGDALCDDYIRQIQACGDVTSNFVVHLHHANPPAPNAVGYERLQRMLAACEPFGVNLCVENLFSAVEIPEIFAHVQHPLLKICYDSGHHHWLTPDFKLVENYHQFISVLHLHQNDGTADQHQILTTGSPVFEKLVREIPLLNPGVTLAAEIKIPTGTCEQILRDNLQALNQLDARI